MSALENDRLLSSSEEKRLRSSPVLPGTIECQVMSMGGVIICDAADATAAKNIPALAKLVADRLGILHGRSVCLSDQAGISLPVTCTGMESPKKLYECCKQPGLHTFTCTTIPHMLFLLQRTDYWHDLRGDCMSLVVVATHAEAARDMFKSYLPISCDGKDWQAVKDDLEVIEIGAALPEVHGVLQISYYK